MMARLPQELLLYVGGFLHHRDARCMQAVCIQWEKIWTRAGLASPHPAVHSIEICATLRCLNRQYLIDEIEPLLAARGTVSANMPFQVLRFVLLLLPVKGIAFLACQIRLTALQRNCTHFEKSMVFWCSCTHDFTAETPLVYFTGPEEKRGWVPRQTTNTSQNLYVWVFLVGTSAVIFIVPFFVCCVFCSTSLVLVFWLYRMYFLGM